MGEHCRETRTTLTLELNLQWCLLICNSGADIFYPRDGGASDPGRGADRLSDNRLSGQDAHQDAACVLQQADYQDARARRRRDAYRQAPLPDDAEEYCPATEHLQASVG